MSVAGFVWALFLWAPGVAGFVRVRLVRLGGLWGSLGSFGIVWVSPGVPSRSSVCTVVQLGSQSSLGFVLVRPGVRWVRFCSSRYFGCALLVRSGGPWRSFGSIGFVWFVPVHHGCR